MNRRRFLTAKEVQAMMQAARQGPTGERDYCLILLAFRHGMRISELLDLHYHDLDLHEGRVNVRRLKNGFSTIHPLRFDECEAIERWTWSVPAGKRRTKRTHCLSPAAVQRSPASRRIVLFAPPVKMRVPSRTLTPICCVTPAAMNWRKEGQIRV
ncbi:type 1 fimbriae regulatory protein FimE [Klebsiella pneumoniae subsp. rhinoscleromatis ATCC 13884]|nr:type 1 fimbriae regulatory protein FimE [Klebsiella pneumoniae subsp. rhinoscleromatis ATCC 13884]STT65702.1 type 1 fimbriae regulatory protein FimE [Klebsiella pneumoniae]STW13383.1 type 1 fimbriae regulatory protein FimE [Klebsiella pneumoniae subsp. rhinoscleromatis]